MTALRHRLRQSRQSLGRRFWSLYAWSLLKASGASVGPGLQVKGRLHLHMEGSMTLGRSVRINSGKANYIGASKGTWAWVCRHGEIRIGDGCAISNTVMIAARRIDILSESFIGGGCEIYDTDFHALRHEDRIVGSANVSAAPIRIGPRAFVGAWCLILKGVSIGEGSVVGAGSVVTRPIPAGEIWAGNPARFIKPVPAGSIVLAGTDEAVDGRAAQGVR